MKYLEIYTLPLLEEYEKFESHIKDFLGFDDKNWANFKSAFCEGFTNAVKASEKEDIVMIFIKKENNTIETTIKNRYTEPLDVSIKDRYEEINKLKKNPKKFMEYIKQNYMTKNSSGIGLFIIYEKMDEAELEQKGNEVILKMKYVVKPQDKN